MRGSSEPKEGRCSSPLRKKPGRFCTQYPVKGRNRCKLHGGATLAGPSHPSWKHGMYSRVVPAGLGEHYAGARGNPDLTSLREQIALIDAKVFEALEQLSHGESPAAWVAVKQLHASLLEGLAAFDKARKSADAIGVTLALQQLRNDVEQLGALSQHGADGIRAWRFITSQIFMRKKLVDSEVRRQRAAHETLDRRRALGMMAYIAQSIARHVTDPAAKQAVIDDMRVLMRNEDDGESVH